MEFRGPSRTDFENVRAINRRFLLALRRAARGDAQTAELSAGAWARLAELGDPALDRLAAVPMLLCSLCAHDEASWRRVLAAGETADLFHAAPRRRWCPPDLLQAVVAFVWHLARNNRYALRLITGAPSGWCNTVAGQPLIGLLECCTTHPQLLRPRHADNGEFWTRLLGGGTASETSIRRAAHMGALQAMLTTGAARQYRHLDAAACRMPAAATRVAERGNRR